MPSIPTLTEKSAVQTREQYRDLFHRHPCPVYVIDDATLAFVEVNDAAVRDYGYSRDEFLKMTLKDIRPAEDVPRLLEVVGSQPDRSEAGVWRHRRKDGSLFEAEITISPVDWQGRPARLVMARNVSQRLHIERALREIQERSEMAARVANDVLWDWDVPSDTVWSTGRMAAAFGYPAERVLSRATEWWLERIDPEEKDAVYAGLLKVLGSDEPIWTAEYHFRRADGAYVLVHDRGHVLRDKEGRALRVIGALRDIARERATETALHRSQELMRDLEAAIQDVFYVSDAKTNAILYINRAFERLWGVPTERITQRPRSWIELVHPGDRERVLRSINGWKPDQMTPEWNQEFRIVRPDGSIRWIWIRSYPIRDEAGKIVRFAGVERDITERRRAEEAIRSLLAITRQLNSTLDMDVLMEALVKETLRLLDAEGGLAGLRAAEGMVCLKYCTPTEVVPFAQCWLPGKGLPGWVAVNKTPYITNDARNDPQITPEMRERFDVRTAICAPLLGVHGNALGFIMIHNKKDGTGFTAEDEDRLLGVSRAAAVAVQNALAFQRLEEAAAALQVAERKYRGIFENALEGIGRTHPDGRILAANPALARMLGYDSPEDLIAGVPDMNAIYVEPGMRASLQRILDKQDAVNGIEVQMRRKDGTPVWLLMNAGAVRDERGTLLHYDGVVQDISARKRTEEALREVSGKLLRSQNEERRRIARELHDSTAQNLAALAMNLSLMGKNGDAVSDPLRRKLDDSLALAQQCCREVRTLSYLLHPPALEEGDLWSALRWFTQGFSDRSGIDVDLTLPKATRAGRLPEEVEVTLFRIVQEGLANIHRHSGSRRARIRITRAPQSVTLVVRDDGRGMRTRAGRRAPGPALLGVGIAGMRERVQHLGGEIDIQSGARGTAVKVVLPVRQRN